MATLDFRSWRIAAEETCWVVGRPASRLNKKKEQELYIESPRFYATLQEALNSLLERELRDSEATTAAEIVAEIKRFRQEINEAFSK